MWIYYLISFLTLFFSEMCSALHSLYVLKDRKHLVALYSAIGSALWCLKIVLIVNQPLTIITAFTGAYIGTLVAFKITKQ